MLSTNEFIAKYDEAGLDLLSGKFFSAWNCTARAVDPVGMLLLLEKYPVEFSCLGNRTCVSDYRFESICASAADMLIRLPREEMYWRFGLLDGTDSLFKADDHWTDDELAQYEQGIDTATLLRGAMYQKGRFWRFLPPRIKYMGKASSLAQ